MVVGIFIRTSDKTKTGSHALVVAPGRILDGNGVKRAGEIRRNDGSWLCASDGRWQKAVRQLGVEGSGREGVGGGLDGREKKGVDG